MLNVSSGEERGETDVFAGYWSSQLFDLRAPSSTDVPVLLLNQLDPVPTCERSQINRRFLVQSFACRAAKNHSIFCCHLIKKLFKLFCASSLNEGYVLQKRRDEGKFDLIHPLLESEGCLA